MNNLLFSSSNVLRLIFGVVTMGIGLFFLITGIAILFKGEIGTGLTVGMLFGILPLALGLGLCVWVLRMAEKKGETRLEKMVIQLAIQQGGKITPTDIVLHSQVSLEEAEKELDLLQAKGLFELQISKEGIIVYHFKQMLSDESKNNAHNII